MKKITIIGLVLLLLISTSISVYAKKDLQVPTNVKLISQSCMKDALFVTVIDLSNNEVVILSYYLKPMLTSPSLQLLDVCRTRMFVNPNEQQPVKGVDAPFSQDEVNKKEEKK